MQGFETKAQQLVWQHGQGQPCGVNLLACRRALVATVDASVTLVASAAVGSLHPICLAHRDHGHGMRIPDSIITHTQVEMLGEQPGQKETIQTHSLLLIIIINITFISISNASYTATKTTFLRVTLLQEKNEAFPL